MSVWINPSLIRRVRDAVRTKLENKEHDFEIGTDGFCSEVLYLGAFFVMCAVVQRENWLRGSGKKRWLAVRQVLNGKVNSISRLQLKF